MNQPQRHGATEIEELSGLTSRIIGAAIEVHKVLGPGLLESIYEAAMCIELQTGASVTRSKSGYRPITKAVLSANTRWI